MQNPANTLSSSSQPSDHRMQSIDFLRGIIMIIMAIDHTRDYFHITALTADPLNPDTTYPALYFTRWITNFCAPTFVFLSGLSVWLQAQRKPKAQLRTFLIKRGLWLIFLSAVVMTFLFSFDYQFNVFVLETLWSIGMGLIVLALLIALPLRVVTIIGLIILLGHNLLDIPESTTKENLPIWWTIMHRQGAIPLWGNHAVFVFYPFLPWAGLTLLGYAGGYFFTNYSFDQRKKLLVILGLAALALFVIVRYINVYGDSRPWKEEKTAIATFYSFMNVQKYPPSLLFCCATIGPVLIFLGLSKNSGSKLKKMVSVFGRVPLFYYLLHFLVLHLAQVTVFLLNGHSFTQGLAGMPNAPFKFIVPGEGVGLLETYGIWVLLIVMMYPVCKWYDSYKTRNRDKWWLSYL